MTKVQFDKNKPEELTLLNVKVEDACLKAEENRTPYLAINVHESEVKEAVTEWVRLNNLGKDEPGVAKFSGSGDSLAYRFKLTSKTEVIDRDGTDAREKLDDGAVITMVATAYAYNNNYGSGVGQKLLAVVVHKAGENINKKAASRLLNMTHQDEGKDEVVPEDIPENLGDIENINMDEIPF